MVILEITKISTMSKTGPIILVEDDQDDMEMIKETIANMGMTNTIIPFFTSEECYNYLDSMDNTQPFIIISDVNLPRMNGIELKEKIDSNERLRRKSVPFIFFSTSVDKKSVNEAYEYKVQGYFQKPISMDRLRATLELIFNYWELCRHPNN